MMAPSVAFNLPAMQLLCSLAISGNSVSNNTSTGVTLNQTSAIIPSGYIPHSDIKSAFKIYNDSVTWKIAREKCISGGARLAVIDSYLKFEYLVNQSRSVNSMHVGIHRMYDDAEWVSDTTGSTLSNLPWAPGNPSGTYDCVIAGYSPRGLRNLACNSKAYYACEIKID